MQSSPLDLAIKEIGYTEGKANANKYSKALGRPAESWCADFVAWCVQQSGHAGDILNSPSVEQICKWATKSGLVIDPKDARPNDIVAFDFTGKKKSPVHIGIVEKGLNSKNSLTTIEGNTSNGADPKKSQSNGDCVARKERGLPSVYLVFRPKY